MSRLPENFADLVERWTLLPGETNLLAGKRPILGGLINECWQAAWPNGLCEPRRLAGHVVLWTIQMLGSQ